MYPKNAASPERIAVGAVVLIADGTVQTSGVSITVTPQGGASGAGGGTTSYEQGVVCYVPTQAETNYTSFIVTAYKASCIPAAVTVVTTASATAGQVRLEGVTHTSAVIPTVTAVGTLTTYTGNTPQTGDAYARLGAPAGASIAADLVVIDNFVDGIESTLAAGVTLTAAGVDAIWDESLAAHQTALTAGRAVTLGGVPIAETTATGTPSTTSIQLTAGSTTDGFYEDQTLVIASGTGAGQARIISTYTGATRTCAFDEPFTTAPAAADALFIKADHVHPVSEMQAGLATAAALTTAQTSINDLPTNAELATALDPLPTAAENADAVWDEAIAGHLTAGTTGAALNAAGSAGDPWSTAIPGAYGAGTAGKILGDNINATISSRASQTSLDTVDDLLDTEVAAIKTVVDAILVDTDVIGTTGQGLTSLATQASVNTIDDFLDTEVAAIKAKTDLIPAAPAAVGDIPTAAQNATAVLTTQMTESYRANAAAPTLAQGICETLAHLGEVAIAGTTKTIKKLDHSTTAETFTLDSSTVPTTITRAT